MIFDTHCHAYWRGLGNQWENVRARMASENVVRSVQIGTDWETSLEALSLARRWGDQTWCAVALHPTSCQDLPEDAAKEWADRLRPLIEDNRDKVVAVGETGLDYHHLTRARGAAQKRSQHAFFIAHAKLAEVLDLPLVIHTRDAASDTVCLMKDCGIRRAVIHCYSEEREFARTLLSWSDGMYFSFSGLLTYAKAAPVQDAARFLPLDRILVETDAPFLVPEAVQGRFRLNEPACARHVMDCLKKLRSESGDIVENTVWENSCRFFRIPCTQTAVTHSPPSG